VPWPVDVVAQLARKHRGLLRGIKDSSGDITYSRSVVSADRELAVFPSSEATLWEAGKDGFAGCISATTNLTAADSQFAWTHQGTDEGKRAVDRATLQRGIMGRQALVSSVKAALGVQYKDMEWARTCLPLLPRTAQETELLVADLRAAGLAL
jgi:4-hydroxy-tetrahydrodipicolinate synthase